MQFRLVFVWSGCSLRRSAERCVIISAFWNRNSAQKFPDEIVVSRRRILFQVNYRSAIAKGRLSLVPFKAPRMLYSIQFQTFQTLSNPQPQLWRYQTFT